jgi:hypothetical protein
MSNTTPSLPRRLLLAAVPFLLLGLAACASSFRSDVTRFQSQLPPPQGQTFAVVAEDPALAGGIEFGDYAKLVAAKLEKYGYREVPPKQAEMLVQFDYGVDNGRERIVSSGYGPDPFWGPWYAYRGYWGRPYIRSRYWGFGWYDPWFDGGIGDVDSYTVYTSGISLKIDRTSDNKRLFEGRAQAVSLSNRLQYLVPNLIEAMFTGFPGNSGETERISIAPEKAKTKGK